MSTNVCTSSETTLNQQSAQPLVPLPCLIPSFADACKLVSAPYSCLVLDTHRRHIALSPMFLNKKRTGIQDELNTDLLKFSESLQGVPLAYDNIRILGHEGQIYDDSGYIHLNIEANFVMFRPQEGQKLVGVVNKLSMNHVGCLVHGTFNASVPKPGLVSIDTWKEAGPRIGAELEFEVVQLDADTAGVLLIRGRLDRTSVQELMARGDSSGHDVPMEEPAEPAAEQPTPEPPEPSTPQHAAGDTQDTPDGDSTPKKKKKKKDKHREPDAAVPSQSPPERSVALEPNGSASELHTPSKKKKHKKDKRREAEEGSGSCPGLLGVEVKEEVNVKEEETWIPIEVQTPQRDSTGYHSDKVNGKRKRLSGDDITSCFDRESETPTKAKKKKNLSV